MKRLKLAGESSFLALSDKWNFTFSGSFLDIFSLRLVAERTQENKRSDQLDGRDWA